MTIAIGCEPAHVTHRCYNRAHPLLLNTQAEINRELDDSNPLIQEIAADFRELIRIDEDVLDLTLRYGRKRTARLRDLQRQLHRP